MKKRKAYLVGIKGVAMTALALYLKESGFEVTGSDVEDIFHTDIVLSDNNISIKKGFDAKNIDQSQSVVIATGAHGGMTNIEMQKAKKIGIPVYMHGEFLGKALNTKKGISIAGSHGKTTTSSLIASLLTHGGMDPSYAVGTAYINDIGFPGHRGRGDYFVVEADEYMTCPHTDPTPRFIWQKPSILVITNIDFDHPDAFSDISNVRDVFIEFSKNVTTDGDIIVCIDDPNVRKILPVIRRNRQNIITYGFSPYADYRVEDIVFQKNITRIKVYYKNKNLGEFTIHIPGRHNALNSLAAMIVARIVGFDWKKIRENIKLFKGTKRRFEKVAVSGELLLYDDYAHHPKEIMSTIDAAKKWFGDRRLIVIFQPHTYSRTKALLKEFSRSFINADKAVITEIYPSAREKIDPTITSEKVVRYAKKHKKNIVYKKDKEQVLDYLTGILSKNDLILTMGAGDIFLWHSDIIELIENHKC